MQMHDGTTALAETLELLLSSSWESPKQSSWTLDRRTNQFKLSTPVMSTT